MAAFKILVALLALSAVAVSAQNSTSAPAPTSNGTPAPTGTNAPAPSTAPAGNSSTGNSSAPAITDADILQFALNLEYLEAEFYSWAAFGRGLSAEDAGNGPASIGGQKALLSPTVQAYATEIANDEINHVRFLRSALTAAGATPVARPLINIGTAFGAAANLALASALNGSSLSPAFSPYGSDTVFLHGAFIFEDVGVSAYSGAAPAITNKAYLAPAAGILAVEAYHAGIIRLALATIGNQYVFPYGAQVVSIINAISDLRGAVGGGNDVGITRNGTLQLVYATNDTSIAYARTPQQVLSIVYGGNATGGLFFPNGLNGNIK
jgi:hypothetical protein